MQKTYDFGFEVRPRLRLTRVEDILKQTKVVDPIPSRRTLIRYLEEGKILQGGQDDSGYWFVFEDSFKRWVRSKHPEAYVLQP